MVYKFAYLNTLLLLHSTFMLACEDGAERREAGAKHYIVMEITLLIMKKSWNCVFEFLWEP